MKKTNSDDHRFDLSPADSFTVRAIRIGAVLGSFALVPLCVAVALMGRHDGPRTPGQAAWDILLGGVAGTIAGWFYGGLIGLVVGIINGVIGEARALHTRLRKAEDAPQRNRVSVWDREIDG